MEERKASRNENELIVHGKAYNEDTRDNIKSLLLDTEKHLILQGANLIQDINNLGNSKETPDLENINRHRIQIWGSCQLKLPGHRCPGSPRHCLGQSSRGERG